MSASMKDGEHGYDAHHLMSSMAGSMLGSDGISWLDEGSVRPWVNILLYEVKFEASAEGPVRPWVNMPVTFLLHGLRNSMVNWHGVIDNE